MHIQKKEISTYQHFRYVDNPPCTLYNKKEDEFWDFVFLN